MRPSARPRGLAREGPHPSPARGPCGRMSGRGGKTSRSIRCVTASPAAPSAARGVARGAWGGDEVGGGRIRASRASTTVSALWRRAAASPGAHFQETGDLGRASGEQPHRGARSCSMRRRRPGPDGGRPIRWARSWEITAACWASSRTSRAARVMTMVWGRPARQYTPRRSVAIDDQRPAGPARSVSGSDSHAPVSTDPICPQETTI